MSPGFNIKVKVARLLLLIWCYNLFFPVTSYALTSGPSQPETQGFQQASVSDMVDLQTGDFKYNIPLLDIDGYPINLNYQSGVGIDDEASWVGLGWSLNTGSINRQLRGLPDDLNADLVKSEDFTKEMITIGGKVSAKIEILGLLTSSSGSTSGEQTKDNNSNASGGLKVKLQPSMSYSVFYNNYTGIGAVVSVNPGISLSLGNSTKLNAGLGFGISSNTQSGASFSPYASLAVYKENTAKTVTSAGLTASLGYNSRSGIKSLSLGTSFSTNGKFLKNSRAEFSAEGLGAGVSYNTEPIMPQITVPYHTSSESYSIDAGPTAVAVFGGGGITGYKTKKKIEDGLRTNPAYGFLYADFGKDNPNALMDFIREKESMIVPDLPNIAVPIPTYDLFSFTNQIGSGQFRLYRGGTGVFFDNAADDTADDFSLGIDIGFGNIAHGGVTVFDQQLHNKTRKWTDGNNYRANGDHQTYTGASPKAMNVFFKAMGEKVVQDEALAAKIGNTQAVKVEVDENGNANSKFLTATSSVNVPLPIRNENLQPTATAISYLTGMQASKSGLDKEINSYKAYTEADINVLPSVPEKENNKTIVRTDELVRSGQKHHISEISVTDPSGRRMVYGVPVYNIKQSEYSFAIGGAYNVATQGVQGNPDYKTNLSNQAIGAGKPGSQMGVDEYYHMEEVPPYATSYLLSGVLSADYLDRTGDGITDDDLGTAIKFNYNKLNDYYYWRAPFENVAINKAQLAKRDDDKGSVIFGKKEIWYISSIESKTKIAYFITKDRLDGLGTDYDWKIGGKRESFKQKCLAQIRLYSKADMTKPIKVVKFDYNYELCPFTPNSIASNAGKLTLKSVWFEYGNVSKGVSHPYKFVYNQPTGITSAGVKGAYGYMLTDRWGVYKSRAENISSNLSNEEFPYSNQNKSTVDENVSLWHLNQIELPTGGTIEVKYESDDYGYVQDKKAMCMYKIDRLTNEGVPEPDLRKANGVEVTLPTGVVMPPTAAEINKTWFVKNYLNGSDFMYVKMNVRMKTSGTVDLNNDNEFDYISSFAEVESVSKASTGTNTIVVKFKKVSAGGVEANPIVIAAWQKLKDEYPGYAYAGYDNKANSSGTFLSVLRATAYAIGNMKELTQSFYEKASGNAAYASVARTNKSFVRLTKNDGDKVGGGIRVKSVEIKDNWQTLSSNSAADNASYGQQYTYKLENGRSSGVASYEPSIGNDENAFKQPIPYSHKTKGAITNFFQLEEPFGESVFPAPGVTYSRVVVRDMVKNSSGDMGPDPASRTGYVVNEFYTTKDFPVKVNVLDITTQHDNPKTSFSLVFTSTQDEIFMSQGYCVELNDMNGKLKATRVFKESNTLGDVIASQVSATEYFYNTDKRNGETLALNNLVKVVGQNGSVTSKKVGEEIELFTDFREQESVNEGLAVNLGSDFSLWGILPSFIPHFPIKENTDITLFRSACAFKVVQRYGILESVVKTQDGSSITTQNIAFDGLTGEAVVTRTQNEFNQDIYSVNIPAYWTYNGMGGAYQSLGTLLSGIQTASDGNVVTHYNNLYPGDVVLDLGNSGELYWVVDYESSDPPYTVRLLMDRNGKPKKNVTNMLGKIVRSGYRNMLDASTSSITCLSNPIVNGRLKFTDDVDLTALKVLNASVSLFDENWPVDVPDIKIEEPETSIDWTYRRNTYTHYSFQSYHDAEMIYSPSLLSGRKQTWEGIVGINVETPDAYGNPFWRSRAINASIIPQFVALGEVSHCFSKVHIDRTGDYIIGVNSNIQLSLAFDNNANLFTDFAFADMNHKWMLFKQYFEKGDHVISMVVRNYEYDNALSAFGVEIYDNTEADITTDKTNIPNNLKVVWSTGDMANVDLHGEAGLATAPHITTNNFSIVTNSKYYWTDAPHNAYSPVYRYLGEGQRIPDPAINPYLYGFRGNWRLAQTMATLKKRNYKNLNDRVVDVKNAGHIDGFRPYWYFDNNNLKWLRSPESSYNWTITNTVTLYDKYGQQLENKDALGRYSAAKFSFRGELPSAVASNARQREIYVESFEDAAFLLGRSRVIEPDKLPYFTPVDLSDLRLLVNGNVSHTGNNSVKLVGDDASSKRDLVLSTNIFSPREYYAPFLTWQYTLREFEKQPEIGRYPKGFEPIAGKYIFNAWVKDSDPTNKTFKGIKLYNNTTEIPLTVKAIVEDWKLVEGSIDLSSYSGMTHYSDFTGIPVSFKLVANGTNVYVDDIRIHPKDASMKTYAYDNKTMRLMAELDENGFATLYEYDSQGLLVRVKKETERGVMTLKESRSSYKKGL